MKTIQAVGNRVIVQPDTPKTTTESGIILTEIAPEIPNKGIVLSVGNKVEDVKEGDYIIYDPLPVTSISHKDTEYFILYESRIIAIINK